MSNNKKWKKRKINIERYVASDKPARKILSDNWKIALTGLFLIAIPSLLVFLLAGKDGIVFHATKQLDRWAVMLPIALGVGIVQFAIIAALIWGFKVLKIESLNFLIAIILAMNSFIVSSDASVWFYRVLPAVFLAFVAIPIIAINKAVAKRKVKKVETQIQEEERRTKSLLD
ncbi:hypothetical protein [[Mycoplasma] anseris]|uniref:Uncharacterized protein n=1 Tax=[Mycoplasma] anseris TaxID=92400 RepID=A0A2Z4NCY6_9BACT|nr:hypothetical protein [[Mycoplasma] anseris]AWX69433.1 hypothetical protein DP065_01530 [[Mycoplasma] anseris]